MSKKTKVFFNQNAPSMVLKSLFNKYDEDSNGELSSAEIATLFEQDLGFNDEQSEAYALLLDKDGNGQISYEEFYAWVKSGETFKNISDKSRYNCLIKAVELFNSYDLDRSHGLDVQEFKRLFIELGGQLENFDTALKQLDKDNNNLVSFPEFLCWLNWIPLEDS